VAKGGVAVVGAGLAGLKAASDLKRLGYTVDLFERSRLLGGKATSFEVNGIEVDNGQHVFLACCTEFIEFMGGHDLAVGMGNTGSHESPLHLQPRFEAMLLSRGKPPVRMEALNLPAPFHLSVALARSHQLGLKGRLEVMTAILSLGRDPNPGESFATWLARHHQGRQATTGFWEPFLVPALNARMDDVAASEAAFVIKTAFLNDPDGARFGYSRIPLGRIANVLASKIDRVRLRSPVVGLETEKSVGSRSSARIGVRLKDSQPIWYDGVVVAVTPERLKGILGSPKEWGVFGLDQFTHAAIVDVHLWLDMPPGSILGKESGFAALLDSPVQWVFEKSAPSGETYLCCSMSAAGDLVSRRSEDLVNLALEELTAVLPAIGGVKLLRGAATRDRDATFVPSIGLVRPGPLTTSPRVTVAGSWTDTGWPATMESAVRSGRQAAEVLHGAIAA
jgi:hydroxysqualene dehydroxylase